ncbi:MAG: SoxR reducing system RseC family protein [Candidatus Wallbacteria bacterium]|nr:SoxR reducing system RseC family protein [Candidatus Wallbacteria bacterium]
MQILAKIIAVTPGSLKVSIIRESEGCGTCGKCGRFRLLPLDEKTEFPLPQPDFACSENETLILQMPEAVFYLALFLAFIVPILILIGSTASACLFLSEILSVGIGLFCTSLYLVFFLKLAEKFYRNAFKIIGKFKPDCPEKENENHPG